MKLEKGKVLKVLKPLYGMPESPMHWFKTYIDYHNSDMNMKPIELDPCLLYQKKSNKLCALLGLQVDDTLYAGTDEFMKEELKLSETFPSKGRTLIENRRVKFNGIDVRKTEYGFSIDQLNYISKIQKPCMHNKKYVDQNGKTACTKNLMTFAEFRSARAQYAYACFSTCPNALVFVAKLSQVTESMFKSDPEPAMKILRKLRKLIRNNSALAGLKYRYIPPELMEVVVCIDGAFATNHDKTSQLGFIVMLRNKEDGTVNVIHYASYKSKRVCKSVLAAELFAMVDGYDVGFSIRHALETCTGISKINLSIYTDSQTLYGLCISLRNTTERRLQIDLALIREAYERRELTEIIWINGKANPADDLTKCEKRSGSLEELLHTGKFLPQKESWIERDSLPVTTSPVSNFTTSNELNSFEFETLGCVTGNIVPYKKNVTSKGKTSPAVIVTPASHVVASL